MSSGLLPSIACCQVEYQSLPDLLRTAHHATSRGDYPTAAAAFQSIRDNYNEEPEWTSGTLPKAMLPLASFASLQANQASAAISLISEYLDNYAPADAPEAFARYILAKAYQRAGESEKALLAYRELRERAPSPNLKSLAAIQEALLHETQAQGDQAIPLLEGVLLDPETAPRAHVQARLHLARIALAKGDHATAADQLQQGSWSQAEMPELASLSFLALQSAEASLAAGQYHDALQSLRLVAPHGELIIKQGQKLAELEARFQQVAPQLSPAQRIWTDFYQSIIASLRQQLTALEAAEPYDGALALRKALCLRHLQRPLESWILLAPLSASSDETLARPAHREWIDAAQGLEAWNASSTIAREYLRRYPDSPELANVLNKIGIALMEQERFAQAAASFLEAATRSTNPGEAASNHLLAGVCLVQDKRIPDALPRFEQAASLAPNKLVAAQATLWIGICQFLASQYADSIATFETIAAKPDWAILAPEALYRKAASLYADTQHEESRAVLVDWLQSFPEHPRASEAHLLLGDIDYDSRRYLQAIESYLLVSIEETELRIQSVLKASDCYQALDKPEEAIPLLQAASQLKIPSSLIGDFYLSWGSLLDAERKRELLDQALQQHGNELDAAGMVDIALERFENDEAHLESSLLAATRQQQATRAARLLLAASRLSRDPTQAKVRTLRLASEFLPESLDPECLTAIGYALESIGSLQAKAYFERVLETYPSSSHIDDALCGLALVQADPDKALELFARVDWQLASPGNGQRGRQEEAQLLLQTGRHTLAQDRFESLIAGRNTPPSRKAQALYGLAATYLAQQRPQEAYTCYQRIFTLYRGEAELVAKSYLHCIEILSDNSEYEAARSVARELIDQTDLASMAAYSEAKMLLERLPHPPPATATLP